MPEDVLHSPTPASRATLHDVHNIAALHLHIKSAVQWLVVSGTSFYQIILIFQSRVQTSRAGLD